MYSVDHNIGHRANIVMVAGATLMQGLTNHLQSGDNRERQQNFAAAAAVTHNGQEIEDHCLSVDYIVMYQVIPVVTVARIRETGHQPRPLLPTMCPLLHPWPSSWRLLVTAHLEQLLVCLHLAPILTLEHLVR